MLLPLVVGFLFYCHILIYSFKKMDRAILEDLIVGEIIRRTSIAAGRESGKAVVGSIKRAPRRHAGKPAPAQRRQRHLHRRCKGLP
jgi:hypothetical protein